MKILLNKIFINCKKSCTIMSLFTQILNPITGQCDWEERCEDYDYHQEVARAAFADMLHDTDRNKKYFEALQKTITLLHSKGKKAHVLDIGTGTGLLSMMAIKCGADTVTACEAFIPMANCAEKIIEINGMKDKIHLIKKRSTEITIGDSKEADMPKRANVLVTEVFDTELIGEGAIGIFNHAHEHLLTDDCIVIPHSATIYGQIVESPLACSFNKPKCLANLDGDILLNTPEEIKNCYGEAAVHDIQLNQFLPKNFKSITKNPFSIFNFVFGSKTPIKNTEIRKIKLIANQNGCPQTVFFWWDLKMDQDGDILLSCAPYWAHSDLDKYLKLKDNSEKPIQNYLPWRDHWMQAIYYLPKGFMISEGEEFYVNAYHDEYSFWFDVQKLENPEKIVERFACNCSLHLAYSRNRIGQINESLRNKKYLRILEDYIDKNSVVLSLSEGSLIGLSTLKMGAKKVLCFEPNRLSRNVIELYEKSNNLENLKIIKSLDDIDNYEEITHVIAEPYFSTSILPWDNFYFGTLLGKIKSKLKNSVKILPVKAKILAVPVEFLDLHKIKSPIGLCEGFNIDIFDKLVANSSNLTDSPVEAQPLWEYPGKALGKIQELLCINFDNFWESKNNSGSMKFDHDGTCNGIACWVDWYLDSTESSKSIVSAGPTQTIESGKFIEWDMFTRQGVYLFSNPAIVNSCNAVKWNIKIDPVKGQLKFNFNIK